VITFGRSFSITLTDYATLTYNQAALVGMGCKRTIQPDSDTSVEYAKGLRTVISGGSGGFRYEWEISLRLTDTQWTELQAFLFEHLKRLRSNEGLNAFVILRDRVMPLVADGRIRDGETPYDQVLDEEGIRYFANFRVVLIPQYPHELVGSQAGTPYWEIKIRAVEASSTTYQNYFVAARGGINICTLDGEDPNPNGDPIPLTWDGRYPGQPLAQQGSWLSQASIYYGALGVPLINRASAQAAAYALLPDFAAANALLTPETQSDPTGSVSISGDRKRITLTLNNRKVESRDNLHPAQPFARFYADFGIFVYFNRGGKARIFWSFGVGVSFAEVTLRPLGGGIFTSGIGFGLQFPESIPGGTCRTTSTIVNLYLLDAYRYDTTDPGYAGILEFTESSYTVRRECHPATIDVATIRRVGGTLGQVSVLVTIWETTPASTAVPGIDYPSDAFPQRITIGSGVSSVPISLLLPPGAPGVRTLKLRISRPRGGALLGFLTTTTITLVQSAAAPFETIGGSPFETIGGDPFETLGCPI